MGFGVKRNMWRVGCALIFGTFASAPVQAEQDVLERPALMRPTERTTTSVLLDIQKAGKRLVAVGERGLILLSDDDGQSWRQAKVPVSVTLTSLAFVDEKTGWAAGNSGVILRTDDGGQSWIKLLDGKLLAELVDSEAKKPGASQSFISDAARLVADGPDKPFLAVHFIDANNGLIVGAYGLIFSTSDGGKYWRPLQAHIDNPKGLHLYSIHDTGNAIYLSGEQGSLFISEDRGGNFSSIKTPYKGTFFGVLSAGRNLLAFGMRGNAYCSSDKGQTWLKSEIPGTNTLTAGTRLTDGRIVLVDDGGNVLVSQDDGKRFSKIEIARLTPLSSVVQDASGQLFFAGVRGISSLAKDKFVTDVK